MGARRPVGPNGLCDFGLVMEWVRVEDPPRGKSGRADPNAHVLAGGSLRHTQPYAFLPSNRSSWHERVRIYNAGFRCVADEAPASVVEPAESAAPAPRVLEPGFDRYGPEPIRLEPTNRATLLIRVPWLPESVWVLDCPEANWGPFGGANAWPHRPEAEWRVAWEAADDGSWARYDRRSGEARAVFEAWVESETVRYRYALENLPPARGGHFCFKTLSPFLSSQERVTQAIVGPSGTRRCCTMPIEEGQTSSLFWSLPRAEPPERPALVSPDGRVSVRFAEGDHVASGNLWPPCTHIDEAGWGAAAPEGRHAGEGSFSFEAGGLIQG